MLIITPEEASSYQCCQINQPCQGKKCMAWVKHYELSQPGNIPNHVSQSIPPHPQWMIPQQYANPYIQDTGKGYCGLVRK